MLVSPSGMSYRVLHVDSNASRMSMPVLKKIAQLAKDGATIGGVKPVLPLGLSDDSVAFAKTVAAMWKGSGDKITAGKPLAEVLNAIAVAPDFSYSKPNADTKLLYVHRKMNDREIYWLRFPKTQTPE